MIIAIIASSVVVMNNGDGSAKLEFSLILEHQNGCPRCSIIASVLYKVHIQSIDDIIQLHQGAKKWQQISQAHFTIGRW